MSKEPELKARDKVVVRMTREGAVEENLTAGTEQRVSKRLEDAELVKPGETVEPSEALSPEEQKKVQMRRQQRQFQAEHAEDNDTQPPSETSVTDAQAAQDLCGGGSGCRCHSHSSGGNRLRKAGLGRCRLAHEADAEARKEV